MIITEGSKQEERPDALSGSAEKDKSSRSSEEELNGNELSVPEERSMSSKLELNDDDSTSSSDHSSPRGVLENSVSSIYSDCGSSSELSSLERSSSSRLRNLFGGFLWRRRRNPMLRLLTFPPVTASSGLGIFESGEDILRCRPSWRSFDYQELAVATNNFSSDKLIGKGGQAEVYKGCLGDGQLVAVKRLMNKQTEDERIGDFLSELGIIAHVNHPNAAQLLGFSVEGGLYLVLRYSPHGSLASVLHGSKERLEWKVRFKIALGIAEGLLYLHEMCHRRIIHRDIKASNILLTDDYQPQISDFGLAKWLPDKLSHHIALRIEGTFGYLAPEYFMHGVVNEKTDVFAYGVLLLELITGRRAVDCTRQSLVIWAKPLLDTNNLKEIIDPVLDNSYDPDELKRAISAASMCINHLSTARPTMNWVVRLLRGEEGSMEFMCRATRPNVGRRPTFDVGDLEDYTCSRYLDDLNRHRQLALEQ
ncbi:receptor-like cytosolic serine/threonine-protein kinase RBK1 isoform X2 [Asparagus officinalis]|uniref:receptor-like cytosolic serine/threonine-protein kinase RBK1 isoform X2 n=1 Tax=Asparagus officinalis TaxID=4686 RepID=UPI00098E3BC2|nr:receptor-like cytosolic serine/threonine-protein kinase RBK1 isoform X2 [Asparagus officinalis]